MLQELSLVSWRLILVDLVMMLYVLAIFAVTISMGTNVTTDVVTTAVLKCVGPRPSGICYYTNRLYYIVYNTNID